MDAGSRLRTARRRAKLSQRALAQLTGIPQSSIARIERNTSTPRVDTYARLLRATGHTLEVETQLGVGVDRTAIRERLRLSPRERLDLAVQEARAMPSIRVRR